ncbi:MAG TPA: hypothetical protein VF475_11895 [Sphingobium sp.]
MRSGSGDGPQETKPARQKKPSGGKAVNKSGKGASGDVGQMLRGAYRQTVDEAIPGDLMDLLNRLE